MNKIVKKFDISKMTEFKPSEVTSSEDDFYSIEVEEIQEKYVKYDQSTAKSFNLID